MYLAKRVRSPMCNDGVEDELHTFFTCPHAIAIWQQVGLSAELNSAIQGTAGFNAPFFDLLQTLSLQNRNTFAMMFWFIWKRRNERLWEGVVKLNAVSIQLALNILHQRERANIRQQHAIPSTDRHVSNESCRKKQNIGVLKCNVVAAVFEGENKYGVGFCVQDDRGTFRCGKTMWFQGSPSPQVAEAMGLVQALQFLRE